MGFEDEMAAHDEQWAEDAERPRTGARLSAGPHQAQIVEARVEKDQRNNSWQWVVKFANKDGSIRKWYNLDHEVGRSIAASDSHAMGFGGKLSGLAKWCEEEGPIGLVCDINVKTKPGDTRDFVDVYVNAVLGKRDVDPAIISSAGSDAESVAVPDDDIPF